MFLGSPVFAQPPQFSLKKRDAKRLRDFSVIKLPLLVLAFSRLRPLNLLEHL